MHGRSRYVRQKMRHENGYHQTDTTEVQLDFEKILDVAITATVSAIVSIAVSRAIKDGT